MSALTGKNSSPIVFVASVTHFGGAVKSTVLLIEEIKKKRDVIVLELHGSCPEYMADLESREIAYDIILPGAKKAVIGGKSGIIRFWRMFRALGESFQIVRVLRKKLNEINPCIIWLNMQKSLFFVRFAVGNKFPTLLFVRGIYKNLKWYCLDSWKKLDIIIANNSESLKFFRQFRWSRGKLAVAHNGIDFDIAQVTGPAPTDLPKQNAKVKIVMPATLIPLKAHAIAIKGFAKFCESGNDGTMWICGDVPNNLPSVYMDELLALRQKLGVEDKVHFLGWRNDVMAIMKTSDIMILTSETEGLPRSILEAMVVGLPVIATRVGGIPEVIRNGVEGFLIDVGDYDAVAKSLEKLKNPDICYKMGHAAQERVKTEFSLKMQADKFLKCVGRVVNIGGKN